MVEVVRTTIGLVLLAGCLWFGSRAFTASMLYRSVSTADEERPSTLVGGETVAIEGTVKVKKSPPLGNSLPIGEEHPIGAYVWRLTEHESHNYGDERSNLITYASGVESGTFTVDDGRDEIRIDTDWLAKAHNSSDVTTVSPEWQVSTPLSKLSWMSQYIQLDEHRAFIPIADMDDVFDADAVGESPDNGYFEARAVLDGEKLAVRGEVTFEQGTPVLGGSDETPLTLSDQGFDKFGSHLRRQSLKAGVISGGLAAIASLALANGLGIV
ncbi:hypothetical protein DJ71_16715 [Halorubrum sp. E3]|nr:hypothetical protein DJ71_16715 [Halorubrum sp. E3]